MGALAAPGAPGAGGVPSAGPEQWYCGCCGVVVPAERVR